MGQEGIPISIAIIIASAILAAALLAGMIITAVFAAG